VETGDHLRKFFLSPTACLGVLHRIKKYNKKVPQALLDALLEGTKIS
jgi:hypothetical protein